MSPVAGPFPITVADVPTVNRYELRVDGELAALASYLMVPASAKIVFTYSELRPGFEGQGLGRQLATQVLEDVRRRELIVSARCPFFRTFIEDHPAFHDLVERTGRLQRAVADPVRQAAGG
jgi:uncharacterized protein